MALQGNRLNGCGIPARAKVGFIGSYDNPTLARDAVGPSTPTAPIVRNIVEKAELAMAAMGRNGHLA
jgi:hypothetical protein